MEEDIKMKEQISSDKKIFTSSFSSCWTFLSFSKVPFLFVLATLALCWVLEENIHNNIFSLFLLKVIWVVWLFCGGGIFVTRLTQNVQNGGERSFFTSPVMKVKFHSSAASSSASSRIYITLLILVLLQSSATSRVSDQYRGSFNMQPVTSAFQIEQDTTFSRFNSTLDSEAVIFGKATFAN